MSETDNREKLKEETAEFWRDFQNRSGRPAKRTGNIVRGSSDDKNLCADPNEGVDELLLLKRNRAVVRLLGDEETLFHVGNCERRISPPGRKARARIAIGLKEILAPDDAESLLAYLDRRGWNFKFSLGLRDLRQSYESRWLLRQLHFAAIWLIMLLLSSLFFTDRAIIQIVLAIGVAVSIGASIIFYEILERRRLSRVSRRENLMRVANLKAEPCLSEYHWMTR